MAKNIFYTTESEFVQWFQISNSILASDEDLLFGCIYIPPENKEYSSTEAFDEVESELMYFKHNNCDTALVGDFNAKTGLLFDFIVPKESVVSIFLFDCDTDILEYMYNYDNLLITKSNRVCM